MTAPQSIMTLDAARTIIAAARRAGREHDLNPLSVVVLDAGGHVTAFERESGSANMRFQIAFGKAHGALALRVGSRALTARAEQQPYFIAAATSAIGGALVPVPGGSSSSTTDIRSVPSGLPVTAPTTTS